MGGASAPPSPMENEMPSKEKQGETQKKILDILKGVPVPVPGSAGNLIEAVRKKIMDAEKKKKKGSEGNSD